MFFLIAALFVKFKAYVSSPAPKLACCDDMQIEDLPDYGQLATSVVVSDLETVLFGTEWPNIQPALRALIVKYRTEADRLSNENFPRSCSFSYALATSIRQRHAVYIAALSDILSLIGKGEGK